VGVRFSHPLLIRNVRNLEFTRLLAFFNILKKNARKNFETKFN